MFRRTTWLLGLGISALSALAQPIPQYTGSGSVGTNAMIVRGASLPSTCVERTLFYKHSGGNEGLYICTNRSYVPLNLGLSIAPVGSVFGRIGTVTAQATDYEGIYEPASANIIKSTGSYNNPAWLTALEWSKITSKPSTFAPESHQHTPSDITGFSSNVRGQLSATSPLSYDSATGIFSCSTCGTGSVASVFGRTGTITAQAGDYSGIYEPVDASILRSSGSYSNPTWLTGLAWSKITEAPSTYAPSAHAAAHLSGGGDPVQVTVAEIASGSKTGSGTRILMADGVPVDGALYIESGVAKSTGAAPGSGGTTTSVASASQSFTSATTVTITHNFSSLRQFVRCYDASGEFEALPTRGLLTTQVDWATPRTGVCGVFGGTGLYSASVTAATTATIVHNQSTSNVAVACYDSLGKFTPSTVDATSSTAQVVISWLTARDADCYAITTLALAGGGGGGGVTSVGLSLPNIFSVSGSPVTAAGTLSASLASQSAYRVFGTAGAGTPSFLALAPSHLPVMVGDSGSGGTQGACPAPAAGDAAAGKFLKADGTYQVPPGGGGGGSYTAGDGIQIVGGVISVDASVPATALSGSTSLTFGSISSGACAVQTITASGATVGDGVVEGWPATLPDGLTGIMHVTATNTISVRLCKHTTGAADVTGLTFTYQIIRGR